jgi:nucleotide-binding universal stress UspA family protein
MVRFEDVLEQFSKQDLKKELQKIREIPGLENLQIEPVSRNGDLVDVIEQISEKEDVELAVMGTKGSNILKELLTGSDTDRFIRMSQNPLLVIPESTDFEKPEKIVYATNLEESQNVEEFKKLVGIVKLFGSKLLVLHVYKDKQPPVAWFEERIKSEAEGINISFHYKQNTNVAAGISEFVNQNDADLLVMIEQKVSLLTKLFRQSVMDKLASSASLPLLIIHN